MPLPFSAISDKKGKWLRQQIKREVKENAEEDDPDYSFFLKHLTPDASGRSYVLHIDGSRGSSSGSRGGNSSHPTIHIRYEAETEAEAAAEDETPFKYNAFHFHNKKEEEDDEDEDGELEMKKKNKKIRKRAMMNDGMLSGVPPAISNSSQINLDPLDTSIDRDYRNFLHRLKLQRDGSLLLHLDNNVTLGYANKHEEDADADADAEAEEAPAEFDKGDERECDDDDDNELLTKVEVEQHRGFPTKIEEEDDEDQKEFLTKIEEEEEDSEEESYSPPLRSSNPAPPRTSNASGSLGLRPGQAAGMVSPFQTRLLKCTNRPYDQREYHCLLKSATARKPVVKYKHLKTRDVPYETPKLGSSYFNYYPDLHEKFKSADRCQRLMLLRGFFFWLENLEHEGAYKPWISTP